MALMPFAAAKAALLATAHPVADTECLDLADAGKRILAEDLISPLTVPPFDNSAMDGYALRASDAGAPGTSLPVVLRVAAGDAPGTLPTGTAARIFTGAPMPAGADAVIMQEQCRETSGQVLLSVTPATGDHVRYAGADIRAGQTILAAGTALGAGSLGLAASVGLARVPVYRRLRVALLCTGDELRNPGESLGPGQIYNANRYTMRGFLDALDIDILDLGIIADNRDATRAALRQAATGADLILASGGMSAGEEDHMVAAVAAEGRIDTWQVAMKPGKPLAFGSVGNTAFIGLPGNPVAVWVGMHLLAVPFLRKRQGLRRFDAPMERRLAGFSYTVKGNRLEFIRVRHGDDGRLECFPDQSSGVLSSAVWADGLAALPAGTQVAPGDWVDYLPGPR
ncbi:MAG: molybdopterin molybdotransferase MoeA [Proteobacteria bacterium]|nr:molybdopterin molybdotransferase MoeA [Pseudomonadota bacterium]HQR03758.1 molybdopterin molybdotransferase MoeA [Rhodocyclaceae bacterium]